jgi:hypothetical protein
MIGFHALATRRRAPALAPTAAALLGLTACGPLTIRTWVNIVPEESSGLVAVNGNPLAIQRLGGGFLAKVTIDTTQILDSPLHGTIELEDVRIGGFVGGGIGQLCTWGNPASPSAGTVTIDLNGGESSAELMLDVLAYTKLSDLFGLPPAQLAQPVTFSLGSGLSLDGLTAALGTGSADGLFSTRAMFQGESELAGFPVEFTLDLGLANGATPPHIDATVLPFCDPLFQEQGPEIFYGLNSKATYLRTRKDDEPAAPLVIPLSELAAVPGDVLRIATVGTYSDETLLADGYDRRTSAVFSSSATVLADVSQRYRVPGAIDAGANVTTASWLECVLIFCKVASSDIGQDFRVDPSVDVVVPAGAAYLIVAPLSPEHAWEDDSGFGFGVDVTVNPTS